LAPKVSVAIDGGGTINLDGVSADVRLRAELSNGNVALRVGVGGDGASQTQCGLVAPSHGVEAAMRLLDVVAQRGRDIRARDLLAAEDATPFRSVVSDLLVDDTPPSHGRGCGETIGQHRLRNGSLAYGIGLAFGHADAATLERLAEAADAAGASGIRLAAGRALMIIGLSRETVSAFVTAAERYGFIVHADDPRRRVVACAGAPICSSAYIAARTIAPLVANVAAPHLDGSRQVHISGCAKGCAHTGSAAVTVVGLPDGCAVIVNGSAHDAPLTIVATEELPPVIARLAREAGEGAHV
jgi:precorrin-3B synthase